LSTIIQQNKPTLFLSKRILIQISLSKNAETQIHVHLSQLMQRLCLQLGTINLMLLSKLKF
jgi:hypothetical protein